MIRSLLDEINYRSQTEIPASSGSGICWCVRWQSNPQHASYKNTNVTIELSAGAAVIIGFSNKPRAIWVDGGSAHDSEVSHPRSFTEMTVLGKHFKQHVAYLGASILTTPMRGLKICENGSGPLFVSVNLYATVARLPRRQSTISSKFNSKGRYKILRDIIVDNGLHRSCPSCFVRGSTHN
jgi:hypothetical protein